MRVLFPQQVTHTLLYVQPTAQPIVALRLLVPLIAFLVATSHVCVAYRPPLLERSYCGVIVAHSRRQSVAAVEV